MKRGCGCGCLTLIVVAALVLGCWWLGKGVFEKPALQRDVGSAVDGRRAQQRLFELATGAGRRDGRRISTTFSERELNALLARHLSGEDLPLEEMGIRLVGDGIVEVAGHLPMHSVLGDSFGTVLGLLPGTWSAKPIWVQLRGYVRLEAGAARRDRRTLRLDVGSFSLGRRRRPTFVLSLLPEGPTLRATRWSVPDMVDSVTVDPGHLTIAVR
jgi:hypothetical protein